MTIKQFNGAYFAHDDRILFRFNTQNQDEYRFWFTRRVTLFILAAASHLLAKKLEKTHSVDAANALNQFEKEAIAKGVVEEKSSEQIYESGCKFPLGFDPILVLDVTCSLVNNDEKLPKISNQNEGENSSDLSIDFVLPGGANINLKLPQFTLQAMCVLLDQLRTQAGWGEAILQAKNLSPDEQIAEEKTSKNISIH